MLYEIRWPGSRARWSRLADALKDWFEGANDAAEIFRVHPDGREERLPSYEEALALLDGATSSDAYLANVSTQLLATMRENDRLRAIERADPLAALEAAERRLLEAGGWTKDPSRAFEVWTKGETHCARDEAVSIARYDAGIERQQLAAKGGAT